MRATETHNANENTVVIGFSSFAHVTTTGLGSLGRSRTGEEGQRGCVKVLGALLPIHTRHETGNGEGEDEAKEQDEEKKTKEKVKETMKAKKNTHEGEVQFHLNATGWEILSRTSKGVSEGGVMMI